MSPRRRTSETHTGPTPAEAATWQSGASAPASEHNTQRITDPGDLANLQQSRPEYHPDNANHAPKQDKKWLRRIGGLAGAAAIGAGVVIGVNQLTDDEGAERARQVPATSAPPHPSAERAPSATTTPEIVVERTPFPAEQLEQLEPDAPPLYISGELEDPAVIVAETSKVRNIAINLGQPAISYNIYSTRREGHTLRDLDAAVAEDMVENAHHHMPAPQSDWMFDSQWRVTSAQETQVPTMNPSAPFQEALHVQVAGVDEVDSRIVGNTTQMRNLPYAISLMYIKEPAFDQKTGQNLGEVWKLADAYTGYDIEALRVAYTGLIDVPLPK